MQVPHMALRVNQFTTWKYKAIVDRLGGTGSAEFSFRRAAQYTVYYAPADSANFGDIVPRFNDAPVWGVKPR